MKNTQKGSVILWVVVIIVILIGVGIIYTLSKKSSSENTQAPTVTQSQNEQQNNTSIPFTKAEKIGNFTVSAVNPHQGSDMKGNVVLAGYTVSFIGTTTLSGTFTKSPFFGTNEDDSNTIAAFTIDPADLDKIPHDRNNPNQAPTNFFYFTNRQKIDSSKGIVYGQRHTIVIADYLLYAIASEGGNSARFVSIVK